MRISRNTVELGESTESPFGFIYSQIYTERYVKALISYLNSIYKKVLKNNTGLTYAIRYGDLSSLVAYQNLEAVTFIFRFGNSTAFTSLPIEYLYNYLQKDKEDDNKNFIVSVAMKEPIKSLIFREFFND